MSAMTREFEASSEVVVYPMLCKLILHLIACYQNVVDCSSDHAVMTNILFWLISVARKSNVITACLHQQVNIVCFHTYIQLITESM